MRLIQAEGGAEAEVAATPDQLFALAADVTRVGEWSHECAGAAWQDGAMGPAVGARFRGRNRVGWRRWSRLCELTAVEPPTRIAWRTIGLMRRVDSTEWELVFVPVGNGRTRITQRYRIVQANPVLRVLYSAIVPTHLDRTAALRSDLQRLGRAAGTMAR